MSRTFDCPDCNIEVRSDKATRWRSNSCDCVLVFEADTLELDFAVQVCDLHKAISNGQLVSTVLAHNNGFNNKFGVGADLTDTQAAEINNDRVVEKARIAALGSPVVKADETTKDRIENDLRSKGR